MTDKTNENAKFELIDGQLIVSIGIEALKRSIEHDTDLTVTDNDYAAMAIQGVISREEEDGRTPFHSMLAEAAWEAYGDGERGLEELED